MASYHRRKRSTPPPCVPKKTSCVRWTHSGRRPSCPIYSTALSSSLKRLRWLLFSSQITKVSARRWTCVHVEAYHLFNWRHHFNLLPSFSYFYSHSLPICSSGAFYFLNLTSFSVRSLYFFSSSYCILCSHFDSVYLSSLLSILSLISACHSPQERLLSFLSQCALLLLPY